MKGLFTCVFLFLISAGNCYAQISTRTIKWKVNAVQDVVAGKRTDHFKELVSSPAKIDFFSKNGQLVSSMAVVGSTVDWADLDQDGTATLSVASGAQKGQLIFKKAKGKLFITMVIMEGAARSIFDLSCSGHELVTP